MSDSIDPQLLDYYQRELTWLRNAGSAFAQRYPKVARRLELSPGESQDPHVERLLEGFALLSGRLQRRLDDDYAEFSDALLEQLYPLALRPLPSCAIVRFEPDPTKGALETGYPMPRDTPLFVTTTRGDSIHFRTGAEVTLWPLQVAEAVLLGGDEARELSGQYDAGCALRLRIDCVGKASWAELGVRQLRLHLDASPMVNATLYDLLGAHTLALFNGSSRDKLQRLPGLPQVVGFADDQALLPDEDGVHPGLRLLAEYFAFPEKFHFFDVPVDPSRVEGNSLYLYLVFDRPAPPHLHLQASDIVLGCAPAINLFRRTSEPLRPDGRSSEYRLVADSHRENSVEIHSIRSLRALGSDGTLRPLAPYYGSQHNSAATLYWHARRINGLTPNRLGSDLLLSLVDPGFDPLRQAWNFSLSAELLCTNRHLAQSLPAGTQLSFERPGAPASARLVNPPSSQGVPHLDGQSRWRLVSQLTLNHLSLVEGPQALDALREMLTLHNLRNEASAGRQIDGLKSLSSERRVAHVGDDAWRGWRKGLEVRVQLDPAHFVGHSTVLFSAVLAQFFSLYATANRYISTVLVDADDATKEIKTWSPQAGMPLSL
ncbi:type VI secretion system baseplate subunit TssF [Pseudomonas sp. 148P]|uniref:Type VI secretion system baseplate subunit TssF n=1 Tax=Pseudomonas ulcerans TaxID=3115852 RepID=A0ABU7HUK7_9PSED|nr:MULTISPECIES: type VI secretion system baseplate subunit TssF [unclassified Pseudomonas]MEE1924049.1 type VI secretion system baseplate subunit TssF [Pseudomonas sp. 147P]MEE1935188.1 type VI secretion system baseplate subunit TssF [Pseudomonas sp. 148P]